MPSQISPLVKASALIHSSVITVLTVPSLQLARIHHVRIQQLFAIAIKQVNLLIVISLLSQFYHNFFFLLESSGTFNGCNSGGTGAATMKMGYYATKNGQPGNYVSNPKSFC